ncbi:hypothetical protein BC940DRAFT_298075 [Gongronella butleri]|nr:hypothetical protein BC940DRAFT_298075 [Gongronella butleri]
MASFYSRAGVRLDSDDEDDQVSSRLPLSFASCVPCLPRFTGHIRLPDDIEDATLNDYLDPNTTTTIEPILDEYNQHDDDDDNGIDQAIGGSKHAPRRRTDRFLSGNLFASTSDADHAPVLPRFDFFMDNDEDATFLSDHRISAVINDAPKLNSLFAAMDGQDSSTPPDQQPLGDLVNTEITLSGISSPEPEPFNLNDQDVDDWPDVCDDQVLLDARVPPTVLDDDAVNELSVAPAEQEVTEASNGLPEEQLDNETHEMALETPEDHEISMSACDTLVPDDDDEMPTIEPLQIDELAAHLTLNQFNHQQDDYFEPNAQPEDDLIVDEPQIIMQQDDVAVFDVDQHEETTAEREHPELATKQQQQGDEQEEQDIEQIVLDTPEIDIQQDDDTTRASSQNDVAEQVEVQHEPVESANADHIDNLVLSMPSIDASPVSTSSPVHYTPATAPTASSVTSSMPASNTSTPVSAQKAPASPPPPPPRTSSITEQNPEQEPVMETIVNEDGNVTTATANDRRSSVAAVAHSLLGDRLDDFTEKLAYIRKNIIMSLDDDDDDQSTSSVNQTPRRSLDDEMSQPPPKPPRRNRAASIQNDERRQSFDPFTSRFAGSNQQQRQQQRQHRRSSSLMDVAPSFVKFVNQISGLTSTELVNDTDEPKDTQQQPHGQAERGARRQQPQPIDHDASQSLYTPSSFFASLAGPEPNSQSVSTPPRQAPYQHQRRQHYQKRAERNQSHSTLDLVQEEQDGGDVSPQQQQQQQQTQLDPTRAGFDSDEEEVFDFTKVIAIGKNVRHFGEDVMGNGIRLFNDWSARMKSPNQNQQRPPIPPMPSSSTSAQQPVAAASSMHQEQTFDENTRERKSSATDQEFLLGDTYI